MDNSSYLGRLNNALLLLALDCSDHLLYPKQTDPIYTRSLSGLTDRREGKPDSLLGE